MTRYAELDVTTNFSFLRGGSHAEELVATAKALGLEAIAVTDRNTLAGVVRAHLAAREVGGIKFIVGARLDLDDAPSLLAYPTDRAAYGRLCRLLTLGQRRAEKGKCTLHLADVAAHADGLIFIALPPDDFTPSSLLSSPGLTGRSSNKANISALPPHPSRHATCAELRSRKIAAESPLPNGARRFDEATRFFEVEGQRNPNLTGARRLRSNRCPMPDNDLAMRRRRALYRATHRGSKELDFLLGRYAEQTVETMSVIEICLMERLIEIPDPEIAASLIDGISLGDSDLDRLMQRLRCFHGVVPGRMKSC